MNRLTRTRRPIALILLTAASLGLSVLPASGATIVSKATVTDATGDVTAGGGAPLPAPAAADIVKAEVSHGTSTVTLTTWAAGGVHPLEDPNLSHYWSYLGWSIHTDGDQNTDASVNAKVVDGAYVAEVYVRGSDAPLCTVAASYDAATFRTRTSIPRSCFGNPAELRFSASSRYTPKNAENSPSTFYYDEAPEAGPSPLSAPATRARIATSLSSSMSTSTITYGQSATMAGTLTRSSDGKSVAGQKVALQRKYPGGSYTNVTTATTNSKGTVSFPIKPSKNATYRLRHAYAGASGPGFDTTASTGRTLKVAPKVTLSASATTVTSGSTVKLTTKVSPKHAGMEVKLQKRRTDGTWSTVQTGKLNAESTRTFKITASKSTAGTYRVVASKHDDHATGTSPKLTVKLG